jgi:NADH-quinone oxidoreductase subunit M
MILSGVMVKMGLFGLLRWLLPMFPYATKIYAEPMVILIVVGMLYASFIAIKQDSIKKLIAYSSIAHIGLMAAGAFTLKSVAINGVFIQMFNHGINIVGLWLIADLIERQTGVSKISELGGVAKKAPVLSIFMVIIAFANIALPLTNAFVGEFMIFNGLYQMKPWIAALAGVSIVLSAIYTLNMVKNVFYGEVATSVGSYVDINKVQIALLTVLTLLIFIFGVYPAPFFSMISETVGLILNKFVSI